MSETPMYFRLFANCIPVRGARRSTICDLQRHSLHLIPNGLYEILTEYKGKSVEELYGAYGEQSRETIEQYFSFLLRRELGHWTPQPGRYPDLDLSFEAAGVVDTALIDVREGATHNFQQIVAELDHLGCRFLQVRSYAAADDIDLPALFGAVADSRLRGLEFAVRYSPSLRDDRIFEWCSTNARLVGVLVHGAPTTRLVTAPTMDVPIRYISRRIEGPHECGIVHPAYFAINTAALTEAMRFNSCLNRKVGISADGYVCNCPAMPKTFGRVGELPLASVVADPAFQAVWHVRKDDIEVCKDCEFRYVCTDCRAHVRDPENPRSKPKGCAYDPYTATWGVPVQPDALGCD